MQSLRDLSHLEITCMSYCMSLIVWAIKQKCVNVQFNDQNNVWQLVFIYVIQLLCYAMPVNNFVYLLAVLGRQAFQYC